MQIAFTEEQEALRQGAAGLLRRADDPRGPGGDGLRRRRVRRRATSTSASSARWARTAGSASAGPTEYGGQDRSMIEQLIFMDEASLAGAPGAVPHDQHRRPDDHALRHRRAAQGVPARRSSPGELHFSIGYSEPEAGTDLASLTTRAVRDGDEYVDQRPEDVDEPHPVRRLRVAGRPHRPGRARSTRACRCSSCRPTRPASRGRRCARWPASPPARPSTRTCGCRWRNLVGEENKGWKLITNQLNHERVALCSAANVQHAGQRRAPLGPRHRRWPTAAG